MAFYCLKYQHDTVLTKSGKGCRRCNEILREEHRQELESRPLKKKGAPKKRPVHSSDTRNDFITKYNIIDWIDRIVLKEFSRHHDSVLDDIRQESYIAVIEMIDRLDELDINIVRRKIGYYVRQAGHLVLNNTGPLSLPNSISKTASKIEYLSLNAPVIQEHLGTALNTEFLYDLRERIKKEDKKEN